MPQVGERRPIMGVRVTAAGQEHIEARAKAEGLLTPKGDPNKSEMARLMLAYAALHMPKGWRPDEAAQADGAKDSVAPPKKPRAARTRKAAK